MNYEKRELGKTNELIFSKINKGRKQLNDIISSLNYEIEENK